MANGLSSGQKPTGVADLDSSQTLQNKTLDASNAINGAPVTGSDVINPSRLDVKKDTQANLVTYASTASNGQIVYATDSKKMFQVQESALAEIGSGAGGINYISNPDFEVNADGWIGDTNLTIARSAVSPLRGDASGVVSKSAINANGQSVKIPFTIDAADLAKKLYISLDKDASDVNYADADLRLEIIKDPNGTPVTIRCNAEDLLGGKGSHLAWFQSDAAILEYELVIKCNSVNALAYSVKIDNVNVGPREVSYGGAMTDWVDYGATPIQGSVTNPTKGNIVVDKLHGKRSGQSFIGRLDFIQNSAGSGGSGDYVIVLPDGIKVDLTKVPSSNGYAAGNVGFVTSNESGGVERHGFITVDANNSSRLFVQWVTTSGSSLQYSYNPWGSSFMSFGNTILGISGQFEIPVEGWSSNSVQSEDIGNREIRVQGRGNGNEVLNTGVTPITFTETEDTTASWSGTTFTSPESGDYDVSGCVRLNSIVGDLAVYAYIDTTGTGSSYVNNKTLGYELTASLILPFAGTVKLEKGHLLQLRPNQNVTLSNAVLAQHNIHIQKKAQPQTILETETVAARYTSNSGAAVLINSVYIYEDLVNDTHNAYNISTGVYTVPVSGKYIIQGSGKRNAAGEMNLGIDIDGASIAVSGDDDAATTKVCTIVTIVSLNKGQTVKIMNRGGGTRTLTTTAVDNYFSIARIK